MKRILFFGIVGVFAFPCVAKILNVPSEYASIQMAIDASVNGDTVLVEPGIYLEQINYKGKDIVVASLFLTTGQKEYINQTIIDGDSYGRPVVLFSQGESDKARLCGFTIQNGWVGSDEWGAGIHLGFGTKPTLENLIVKNNFSMSGGAGGINTYYASGNTIKNCEISNNYATGMGRGGIHSFACWGSIIENCVFDHNMRSALFLWRGSAKIINCLFKDNGDSNPGYATVELYTEANNVEIINTNIVDNKTEFGLRSSDGTHKLFNSIVSGHYGKNIVMAGGGPIGIDYSLVEGGYDKIQYVYPAQVQWGEYNLTSDPMFVNPSTGDFHLLISSPCIDAGTELGAPFFDLDQIPRPSGLGFDIGCYEFVQRDPTLLIDLKVDGETIRGFNPLVMDYTVRLPFGTTQIPRVSATLTDPTSVLRINQAVNLPGTAVVEVTSADQVQSRTYKVNFIVEEGSNWLWSKTATGDFVELGFSVCSDNAGNVYMMGRFWSKTLGFEGTNLSNAGGADIFISKYSTAGQLLWVKKIGGESPEFGYDLFVDPLNNIYLVGGYSSRFLEIDGFTLNCRGNYDILIVKMDSNGNLLWAKGFGSSAFDIGKGVAVDAIGNVIVTGSFSSSSLTIGSTVHTCHGPMDIITIKMDPSGNVLWSRSEGGSHIDFALSTTVDLQGQIYLTGGFRSEDMLVGNQEISTQGGEDVFILKYSPDGNPVWCQRFGAEENDFGQQVASNQEGDIFVVGSYRSSRINFGAAEFSNAGFADGFLIRLSSTGNVIWAKSIKGDGWEQILDISISPNGNAYIFGSYGGKSLLAEEQEIRSHGEEDMFISKFDPNGNLLWLSGQGGLGNDNGYGIATGPGEEVYITGLYESSFIQFGSTRLENQGSGDLFLSKIQGNLVSSEPSEIDPEFSIFPNPTHGQFTIITPPEKMEIRMYSMNGSLIKIFEKPLGIIQSQITLTSGGIYFINSQGSNRSYTQKIFVIF